MGGKEASCGEEGREEEGWGKEASCEEEGREEEGWEKEASGEEEGWEKEAASKEEGSDKGASKEEGPSEEICRQIEARPLFDEPCCLVHGEERAVADRDSNVFHGGTRDDERGRAR